MGGAFGAIFGRYGGEAWLGLPGRCLGAAELGVK